MARDGQDDSKPGLYNLLAEIVYPQLIRPLLDSEPEDRTALTKLFDWIETLATDGDDYVRAFVQDGIGDELGVTSAWLTRSRLYMGPATRVMSDRAEKLLKRRWAHP